ncbi:DUF2851 family protein [Lacihabitans soyangensis]|uniref:DUF2851 family protein n=1 Tax=Lacihabitans soyangensis TaxID=869394 RepID=A0AAE3H1S2_9BACT|nr:DUF2851 family protein [Lacihabitans soyangensis]MCP9763459.1 DUF2851 family protein [Lacihabitans soyangensis]
MKNEDFIHYTWQYQQFDKNNLKTTDGQLLTVLKPGYRNSNSGPDFENARVSIGQMEWAGKVEIHIKSSDWNKHQHQLDTAYENVILHVVWDHDEEVFRSDNTTIPTLEIKDLVFKDTLRKYENLLKNTTEIPCQHNLKEVSDLAKISMIEKALAHRLQQKSEGLKEILESTNADFEELAYRVFARNMGFKLNSIAFLRLAEVLPYKIIQKHRGNLSQIEALMFGQAGFLDEPNDEYSVSLAKEYQFLATKYGLLSQKMERREWRFLRTRLGNFPTVRISQLAAVLNQAQGLFSLFVEDASKESIEKALQVLPSEYWQQHYDIGKKSDNELHGIGKSSIENLLINTSVQLLAFYSEKTDDYGYFEKAIKILETIKPEQNFITKIWQNLGFKCSSAFDSQALIEQFNYFCSHKRCTQCAIGVEILKKA